MIVKLLSFCYDEEKKVKEGIILFTIFITMLVSTFFKKAKKSMTIGIGIVYT